MARSQVYKIYHGGFLIGIKALSAETVKKMERAGYRLKLHNPVTRSKARTILEHGEVKGHELTPKQRRFFGARASGYPVKKANPKGLVLIYRDITRIEGTKGSESAYPGEKFYHNFKRPYPSMYGTPDKKILIIK